MSESERWINIAYGWRVARLVPVPPLLAIGIFAGRESWAELGCFILMGAFLVLHAPLLYAYGRADSYREIERNAETFT